MMKKALVTGGFGFVGSHIVKTLLKNNIDVRILTFQGESTENLNDFNVESLEGDLRDKDSLHHIVKGCDACFHVAAIHTHWVKDVSLIYDINCKGTKNLVQACKENNIEKFVYTSTQNTIGTRDDEFPSNEETPFNMWDRSSHYTKSKYLAEVYLLEEVKKGFPAVIVNPSGPFGRGDRLPGPTGQTIISYLNGKTPFYIDGTFNGIYVDDVADGHYQAAIKGVIGEKYILGNQDFTTKEYFDLLSDITGIRPKLRRLNSTLVLIATYLNEYLSKYIIRKPPLFSLSRIQTLLLNKRLDVSKARNVLGLKQTSIVDALKEEIEYFKEKGFLKSLVISH